jgi:hypothetical protein
MLARRYDNPHTKDRWTGGTDTNITSEDPFIPPAAALHDSAEFASAAKGLVAHPIVRR